MRSGSNFLLVHELARSLPQPGPSSISITVCGRSPPTTRSRSGQNTYRVRLLPSNFFGASAVTAGGRSRFLFPDRAATVHVKDLKAFWRSITQAADLHDYRIHDNRHTHASHLISSGLSLPIVGRLLGHTNPSTTQRYAHLADDPLRQAAEIFGQKLRR